MLQGLVRLNMSLLILQLLCFTAYWKYAVSASARPLSLNEGSKEFHSSVFREISPPFLHEEEDGAVAFGSSDASRSISLSQSPSASATFSVLASTTPDATSPSLSASASTAPIPSTSFSSSAPVPSVTVTPNPSPCTQSLAVAELLKKSYVRHAALVRQSVPMPVVKSFYEHALTRVAQCRCRHEEDHMRVDLACVFEVFSDDGRWMTRRLEEILEMDISLPDAERLFPHFEKKDTLPEFDELEKKAMGDGLESSLGYIEDANETHWSGVVLPADEVLRYDGEHERACEEFSQRMDKNSLWISATSLTSYVLGMLHQLVLLPRSIETGKEMLDKHVQLVYLAARCKRLSGDRLRVPVVFLESIIKRTHLALKNSSIGSGGGIIGGFPALTRVQEIVDVSRELFPGAIEQMSSMNSFGRARVLWWNGSHVFVDNLEDVMLANATGREYNELCNVQAEVTEREVACGVGFTWRRRLREVEEEKEKCCSNGCIRLTGRGVKQSVMNEMCCEACNSLLCNVEDLAQVIEAQSYGFEHSRESSVVNVW